MTAQALTRWLASNSGFTLMGSLRALARRHGAWSSWLVALTWAGCIAAFIADLVSANTLAFGVFYMPLVATAVFHRDRHVVWLLTALACLLVVIGSFFPLIPNRVWDLVENRALSICAILVTGAFVSRAQTMQDQLAAQTAQAEASERMRMEVLTNLSEEIRAPLHGMIGVLELVAAHGDPSHRAALNSVRGSGRRLAVTVDNLVDLTQLDTMSFAPEPFDLGLLTRQIMEARRRDAAERQITLSMRVLADPVSTDTAVVHANQWAVRRILENKIGDAIAYTAPGSHIAINVIPGPAEHEVVITAPPGAWPAGAFQSATGSTTPLAPSAMGLALSQRLARAIGARLSFASGPDQTSIVRLALPAPSVYTVG
jgi:signal transduction histidine kinase